MKKKLTILLALVLALSLICASAAIAFEAATEEAAITEAGSPEGESADAESPEGESPEGESPEDAASEGEAEEEAAPAEEGESGGDAAEEEPSGSGESEVDPEAEAKAAAERERLQARLDYVVIPADGEQVELGYIEGVTPILEVDGLKFKDMNKNGELDVYEDWRNDIDTRVADLISQLTIEEEAGLLFCCQPSSTDLCDFQEKWNVSCFLFNENGSPEIVTNTTNNLQAHAEGMRLGIPWTFTSDREYNAWGGYVDKAHEAFGSADDPQLAYDLAYFYGQAMRAVGIHVTFEPYANEIGAQYGENPELIAEVVHAEIQGLEDAGFASCTKHWIGRGGDSSFGNARSVAQNFDNWMVGWKAALSGGSEWVMTNCGGTGITNTTDVKWDSVTMGYLRNELGFDGVVVTDWWALGGGPNNPGRMTGITVEGDDLSTWNAEQLYDRALDLGTDVFGGGRMEEGTNYEDAPSSLWPQIMINGMTDGTIKKENADGAATRVLRFKFKKGLFENPYCDVDAAIELTASPEWAEQRWAIDSNEALRDARNPYEVELSERLQAESAILIKNDDNLLPLEKGIKVYLEASNKDRLNGYTKYIGEYAEIVDDPEEADVMIGDFGAIDDACELFLDDAADYEKPAVLTLNQTQPTQYAIESAQAVMYLRYSQNADHGQTEAGFITSTLPWVYADLLFGEREPGGVMVKELARNAVEDDQQWKDLAGDQGASPYVRLMVQAVMEDDENHASPNNWGDPLIQAFYGMSYGQQPEFKYSCLILPMSTEVVTETVESGGSTSERTSAQTINKAEAGVPFTAYVLLRNNGADGITTVDAYVDGELAAQKIYTCCGGSWRVVQIDLTIDEAGEHEIMVGDQVATLTVGE